MKQTAPKRGPGRAAETAASLVAMFATLAAAVLFVLARTSARAPASEPATAPSVALAPTETAVQVEAVIGVSGDTIVTEPSPTTALEPTGAHTALATQASPVTPRVAAATPTTVPTSLPTITPTQPAVLATHSPPPPTTAPTVAIPTLPPATAAPTLPPEPTAVASATPPAMPLSILNDQACPRPELNQLYIYGEVHNPSATIYDIYELRAEIFDAAGPVNITNQWFDLPGEYYLAPNATLPFVIIAQLEQPGYTHYEIDLTVAPTERFPRNDLSIAEFAAAPDGVQVELTGRWAHSGARPERFVSIVATAYNGDGRVANMSYLYLTNTISLTPDLPEGQHAFTLYLPASPCGGDNIAVNIVGE